MNPENDIEKLLTAVGAMGELGHAMFLSFEKAGFDHDDALIMAASVLSNLLKPR